MHRTTKIAAQALADVYLNRYTEELNRKLVSLGHKADSLELWQAHRGAAMLACGDVWSIQPDVPPDVLAMNERVVVADMLGSVGADEKAFYMHMIYASVEAMNSGDIDQTTPLGFWVVENAVDG
jgi:hypothetical protein